MTSLPRSGSHNGNNVDRSGDQTFHRNQQRLSSAEASPAPSRSRSKHSGDGGGKNSETIHERNRTEHDTRPHRAYEQGGRGNVNSTEPTYRRTSKPLDEISAVSSSSEKSSRNPNSTAPDKRRSADRERERVIYSDGGSPGLRDDAKHHVSRSREEEVDRYYTLQQGGRYSSRNGSSSLRRSTSTEGENIDQRDITGRRSRDRDQEPREIRRSSSQTGNPELTNMERKGQQMNSVTSDRRRPSKSDYEYQDKSQGRRSSEMYRDSHENERRRGNSGPRDDHLDHYYHDNDSRSVRHSSSKQSLGSDSSSRKKTNSGYQDRDTEKAQEVPGRKNSNVRSSDYGAPHDVKHDMRSLAYSYDTKTSQRPDHARQKDQAPVNMRASNSEADCRQKNDGVKSTRSMHHQRSNEDNETVSSSHHEDGKTKSSSSRSSLDTGLAPSSTRRDERQTKLAANTLNDKRLPDIDMSRAEEPGKNKPRSQASSNLANPSKNDSPVTTGSKVEKNVEIVIAAPSKGNGISQTKSISPANTDTNNKLVKLNQSQNEVPVSNTSIKEKEITFPPENRSSRSGQETLRAIPKAESTDFSKSAPKANSSTPRSYITGSISSLLSRASGGQTNGSPDTDTGSVSERWRKLLSESEGGNAILGGKEVAAAMFSAAASKLMSSLPQAFTKNIPMPANPQSAPKPTATPLPRAKTNTNTRIPDFSTVVKKEDVFSIPRSKTEEKGPMTNAKLDSQGVSKATSRETLVIEDKRIGDDKQSNLGNTQSSKENSSGDNKTNREKIAKDNIADRRYSQAADIERLNSTKSSKSGHNQPVKMERTESLDKPPVTDKLSILDQDTKLNRRQNNNDNHFSSKNSSISDKQISSEIRSNSDRKLSSDHVSGRQSISDVTSRAGMDIRRTDHNADRNFASCNGKSSKLSNPRPSVISSTLSNTRATGYSKLTIEKSDSPHSDDSGQMTPQEEDDTTMKRRSKEMDSELTSFLPAEMSRREEKFHDAARLNDATLLRALLKEKVNVNCRNSLDRTALHWAAANGNLDAVEALIEGGADLEAKDKYGMRAILWSAWFGHIPVLKVLTNAGANTRVTNKQGLGVLHCAAENNHVGVISFIFEALEPYDVNKKDQNDRTPLHSAAEGGHFESVVRLLEAKADIHKKDKAGMTAVHLAAKNGHMDVLKALLMQGVEVDDRDVEGKTALHLAAEAGHKETVDLLLDYTANPNSETIKEFTPLHLAAVEGHIEVCMSLVRYGCNTNAQNYQGNTALFLAANGNHKEIARILVDAKCEIDLPNCRMQTPLHVAVECGHLEVVQVLLAGGASVDAREKSGKSSLQLAARGNHVAVVDMLIKAERYYANTREYHDKDVGYVDPDSYLRKAQHPHAAQMKEVLWKLATKQLKPTDWKKLAYHWHFTVEHVKAIEQEYTGPTSYKDHGYRLLNIWLHGVRKDENVLKLLFEALVAIDRKQLAENVRKKVHLLADKPCSPTLCSVS